MRGLELFSWNDNLNPARHYRNIVTLAIIGDMEETRLVIEFN
jgi:hypothetical protein